MDTKGIIIEAMRKLLAERGFHKITVQDILDAAHCSRGTFYRHFRDKYDIMNYFYLQIGACPKRGEQKVRHDGSECGILRL